MTAGSGFIGSSGLEEEYWASYIPDRGSRFKLYPTFQFFSQKRSLSDFLIEATFGILCYKNERNVISVLRIIILFLLWGMNWNSITVSLSSIVLLYSWGQKERTVDKAFSLHAAITDSICGTLYSPHHPLEVIPIASSKPGALLDMVLMP